MYKKEIRARKKMIKHFVKEILSTDKGKTAEPYLIMVGICQMQIELLKNK